MLHPHFYSQNRRQNIYYLNIDINVVMMASVDQISEQGFSVIAQPVQHDDEPEDNGNESKEEVKFGPNFASFHDEKRRTCAAYESLKSSVIGTYNTLETKCNQLKANEEHFEEISRKISTINIGNAIKLNVGGNIFQTSVETLTKYPESLIAEMFSAKFNLKTDDDGCYFIDRDGTHFRHILNYLRSGTTPVSSVLNAYSEEISIEAEYYGLVVLLNAIKAKLNGDIDNDEDDKGNAKEGDEELKESLGEIVNKELCVTKEKLNSFLSSLDANIAFLDEATSHYNEISRKLENVHFSEGVKINVGGRVFKTTLKTLQKESESLLSSMFSERYDLKKEDDGCFFIDRDGTNFHHILNYLRVGKISEEVLGSCGSNLLEEAEFYGLAGLKEQIQNYNILRLNVGGRQFIANREVMKRHPESIFGRMVSGGACAFEKRDDGSYYIDRDSSCFQHILDYLDDGTLSDNVIERNLVHLMEEAEFYMLNGLKELICRFDIVKINVGGKEFSTTRGAIRKYPKSKLFQMLLGNEHHKLADGIFFIDRDGTYFHHILNYLRVGKISEEVLNSCGSNLLEEAKFYGLAGLKEQIQNYNILRLNVGGRQFIANREVMKRHPESIFGRMVSGGACAFEKRDDGSYYIDRDSSCFQHILDYLDDGTLSDNVIERNLVHLMEEAEFYMLNGLKELICRFDIVKINVGGKEFSTTRGAIRKYPKSKLFQMLLGNEHHKLADGIFFIDRDGTYFHHILNYLRVGKISEEVLNSCGSNLLEEAKFYGLAGLKEQIHNYNVLMLNVGGRLFIVNREVLKRYPESMFGRMVSGRRCAFEKRDDGSYYTDRDSSCFQHILGYLTIGNISDEVIEKNGPEILEEAIFYMLSGLKDQIYKYSRVKVTVGGKDFIVSRKVLKRYPNSMFGRMLLGKDGAFEKVSDDSFYIERDCAMFHHILNYLRVGRISDDVIEECGLMICKEAEFYGLAGLKEQIQNSNVLRLNVIREHFIAKREVMKKHP